MPLFAPAERYVKRWSLFWCLVTAAGVVLASLEWSPLVVVTGVALDSAALAGVTMLLQTCLDRPHADLTPGWSRRTARRSLFAVSGVVAATAMAIASPWAALVTVLAAGLSSPPVVRHSLSTESHRL